MNENDAIKTRIKLKRDTTQGWNEASGFIPLKGEMVIYTDWKPKYVVDIDGRYVLDQQGNKFRCFVDNEPQFIPGLKVGDGKAYVQDLPFVDEELRARLIEHIEDHEVHLLTGEREFWNSKVDIIDEDDIIYSESDGDGNYTTLIFTRDDWNGFKESSI